jgi:hypothetical protein
VSKPLEAFVASNADVPLAGPPSLDDLAQLELAVRMIGTAASGDVIVGRAIVGYKKV